MAKVDSNLSGQIAQVKTPQPSAFQKAGLKLNSFGSIFSSSKIPGASAVGDVVSLLGDAFQDSKGLPEALGKTLWNNAAKLSNLTSGLSNSDSTALGWRSLATSGLESINPIAGKVAGAVNMVTDLTGIGLDAIDETAAKASGVSSGALLGNKLMTAIPGLNLVGGLLGSNNHKAIKFNDYGNEVLGGYSGSQFDNANAQKLSGKRTLFGSHSMNNAIRAANRQTDMVNAIGRTNSLRKNSNYDIDLAQQNLNRYVGTNYQTYAVGKNGMKILSKAELQRILTKKLQKGGVIGTDTNILPEGALHARLNHLDEINPELEDITKKGIPVLDANGDQVAEVESNELILRLEVTQKIEELMKDGSDEAMIEAGKLLVDELIDNTQDNTGQITEEVQDVK